MCKLSGFGISARVKNIEERTLMEAMQGTVFWMAPEVVNTGLHGYNGKTDIWSLGCLVLEMWTGERPWHGEEAMSVIVKLYSDGQTPPVPGDLVLGVVAEDFRRSCFSLYVLMQP